MVWSCYIDTFQQTYFNWHFFIKLDSSWQFYKVFKLTSSPLCCAGQFEIARDPEMKSFWTSTISRAEMGRTTFLIQLFQQNANSVLSKLPSCAENENMYAIAGFPKIHFINHDTYTYFSKDGKSALLILTSAAHGFQKEHHQKMLLNFSCLFDAYILQSWIMVLPRSCWRYWKSRCRFDRRWDRVVPFRCGREP